MLQSNISRYYFQKLAEILVVLIVITVTAYSFVGLSDITDNLHTTIFVIMALVFHKDKNILSILLILGLSRVFPQIVNKIDFAYTDAFGKGTLYAIAVFVCYQLRYDNLAKFSLAILFCMVTAEIYWWFTEYSGNPPISYYCTYIVNDVAARHLLLNRVSGFGRWSKNQFRLSIDWLLYYIMGLFILVLVPFIMEYFFRHMLLIPSTTIYNVYSEIVCLLNAAILWVILNYALKKTALFQA